MDRPGPGHGREDPYRLLGVDSGASGRDIVRAYRRAVHDAHPDIQPGDPRAAARFRALTDAYDLLSDPGRRADYDRQHPAGPPDTDAYDLLSDPGRRADYDRQHPAGPPDTIARWPGSLPPVSSPSAPPVWAGPVRIEPPAARASSRDEGGSPAANSEDPPVILGRWLGHRGSWPR